MKYSLVFDSLAELNAAVDTLEGVIADAPPAPQAEQAEQAEPAKEDKPKRTRRTKAEIEADNKAAAAEKEVPAPGPAKVEEPPTELVGEVTFDDVKVTIGALVKKHTIKNAKLVLQRAGLAKLADIKPASFALVVALCNEQLAKDVFDLDDSDAPKAEADDLDGL